MAGKKAKYAHRGGKKFVTLTIRFDEIDAMKKFAIDTLPPELWVYEGDALDMEFTGNAPAGSYVVRRKGEKPEEMRV